MMSRLFFICLFGAGLVLGQEEQCLFTETNQGLSPDCLDAVSNDSAHLADVSDEQECRQACCSREDCKLALFETPADGGSPRCVLVKSLEDAKDICVLEASDNTKAFLRTERAYSATEYCRFEKEVGRCRASFRRFYYDVTDQTCKMFVYGGCGGNRNRFETEEECQNACRGITGDVLTASPASLKSRKALSQDLTAKTSEDPLPEMTTEEYAKRCLAEPQVGMCKAYIPRYYYASGTCKPFIYGGCGGNDNSYDSEEDCMKTCTVKIVDSKKTPDSDNAAYQEACVVPADSGPCRAAFPVFYFEPNSQSCQEFIYGGCKGNKNRYNTLEECMSNCAGKDGGFDQHGDHVTRWTPAFFLVSILAVMSVMLFAGLLVVSVRRVKQQRLLLLDDKQELLPEEYIPEDDSSHNESH
ncbi:kunitz-type protease inhibitor 2 [Neoarius graeffei]|uniref:kunitz-type protease inhibitor 2 n=1 Tax=Neoarius graeffei TaxID=443677 RepID=UPI00298C786B|nr:kunitz-type protease inhibitor 2 [Neoarius graeffei]